MQTISSSSKNLALATLLIALFTFCFALNPKAHAVTPPPDGGYPGGNTAEGFQSLQSLTIPDSTTQQSAFRHSITTRLVPLTRAKDFAPFSAIRPAASTWPPALIHCITLLLVNETWGTALVHSSMPPLAPATSPLDRLRFTTTLPAPVTQRPEIIRFTIIREVTIWPMVPMRCLIIRPAQVIQDLEWWRSIKTRSATNTATGNGALRGNINGNANVADGNQALYHNTTGVNNYSRWSQDARL